MEKINNNFKRTKLSFQSSLFHVSKNQEKSFKQGFFPSTDSKYLNKKLQYYDYWNHKQLSKSGIKTKTH